MFFDTQDFNTPSQSLIRQEVLKKLLQNIDIPKLEKLPKNHVLKRSFYLLDQLPGLYNSDYIWVEANIDTTSKDGVSSIIIGPNYWSAGWMIDQKGRAIMPSETDPNNELAKRFGVNLIMYALLGNYKTDQFHAAELIKRGIKND